MLEKILANELWSKETSWIEKMELVWWHNKNSSSSYSVKKWILKMSYKAKDRKKRMQDMQNEMNKLQWNKDQLLELMTKKEVELRQKKSLLDKCLEWTWDELIDDIDELIELINKIHRSIKENLERINLLQEHMDYLWKRLKNMSYNIEVEIQIFDVENYLKAEKDVDSPAFHWSYKRYQRVFDIFPKLFPAEVYWEDNLKSVIMPVIDEKFSKEWTI